MKNIRFAIVSAASAALLFASCAKEADYQKPETQSLPEEGITYHEVQLIAGGELTKTYLESNGANGYNSIWDSDDVIALFQKYELSGETKYIDKTSSTAISLNDGTGEDDPIAGHTATFTLSLTDKNGGSNYKYWAAYPLEAVSRSDNEIKMVLPANQTISTNKFDKAADLLISRPVERAEYSSDALETSFARVGSIVRLTLTGLTAGETVKTIVFSTKESGKYLAGTIKYDLTTDALKSGLTSGSQSITLTPETELTVPVGGTVVVWMRTAEVTLADNFKVVVNTNDATKNYAYTKEVNLVEAGKTVAFKSGKLGSLTVATGTKTTVDYIPVIDDGYYLVAYSSQMMTVGNSNNAYRGIADLVTETNAAGERITNNSDAVWEFTFNSTNGKYTIKSISTNTYLLGASGSTSLTLDETGTEFVITEDSENNTYTIANGSRYIGYNDQTDDRFAMYTGTNANQPVDLKLYKAYVDNSPVLKIDNITLNSYAAVSTPVTIVPTTSLFVTSITVNGAYNEQERTSDADWLTVTYSEGNLKYTASENENSTERTAYVSVTAKNADNDESDPVIFSITQPGKVVYSNQWILVKSLGEIDEGDVVVFACAGSGKTAGSLTSSTYLASIGTSTFSTDADKKEITSLGAGTVQFTLGKSNGNWTFAFSDDDLLGTNGGDLKKGSGTSTWSISFSGNDATITSTTASNGSIKYNSSSPRFKTYTTAQTAIQIYKFHPDTTPRTINITTPSNGTVTTDPSGTTTAGTTVTITATPSDGYVVRNVSVLDGSSNEVSVTTVDATHYRFSMPASDATVTVTFGRQNVVNIAYGTDPAHGSISISPASPVFEGETVTVTPEPDTDYMLSALTYNDGSSHDILSAKSFTMPGTDVTVTATFVHVPTISVNETHIDEVAAAGVSSTVAAYNLLYDASDDYVDISCDGTVVEAVTKNATVGTIDYTVAANTGAARDGWIKVKYGNEAAHEITVSQLPAAYTLTLVSGGNGTVSANFENNASVAVGETVNVTVDPSEGYQLATLVYNAGAEDINIKNTKEFSMPAHAVTVSATFEAGASGYTLTLSSGSYGSITAKVDDASVSSGSTIDPGKTVTINTIPNTGYALLSLKYNDGSDHDITSTKSFTMPSSNVTVTAVFVQVAVLSHATFTSAGITLTGTATTTDATSTIDGISVTYKGVSQNAKNTPQGTGSTDPYKPKAGQLVLFKKEGAGYIYNASSLSLKKVIIELTGTAYNSSTCAAITVSSKATGDSDYAAVSLPDAVTSTEDLVPASGSTPVTVNTFIYEIDMTGKNFFKIVTGSNQVNVYSIKVLY